jgi:hypothetical protein
LQHAARRSFPAVLVLVAALGWVAPARPAVAQEGTAGACPDTTGVSVVVDAQELQPQAGPSTRCAPSAGGNGLEILTKAGVSYQTASRSPGFVCKVAGLPSDAPCTDPSPADAYWSYWLAVRGGSWCLSDRGAQGRNPPAGTVEGWSFAKDRQDTGPVPPRTAPPARGAGEQPASLASGECDSTSPTAPAPTTTTAATATTTNRPTPGAAGADAVPPTSRVAAGPATPKAGTAVAETSTTAGMTTTTVSAEAPTSPASGNAGSVADASATGPPVTLDVRGPTGDDGSGAGRAIAGGGAVAAIGAAGIVVARCRRLRAGS